MVSDIAKAYDKVERKQLLQICARWIHDNELRMVRDMMGPMRVRTKGGPTGMRASIRRGVSQGAPSSPIYFNMYIDSFSVQVERRVGSIEEGEGS